MSVPSLVFALRVINLSLLFLFLSSTMAGNPEYADAPLITTPLAGSQAEAQSTILSNGNIVLAYVIGGIGQLQRISPSFQLIGNAFKGPSADQVSIMSMPNGGFFVAYGEDVGGTINGEFYNAEGVFQTGIPQINGYYPSCALLQDTGNIVVTFYASGGYVNLYSTSGAYLTSMIAGVGQNGGSYAFTQSGGGFWLFSLPSSPTTANVNFYSSTGTADGSVSLSISLCNQYWVPYGICLPNGEFAIVSISSSCTQIEAWTFKTSGLVKGPSTLFTGLSSPYEALRLTAFSDSSFLILYGASSNLEYMVASSSLTVIAGPYKAATSMSSTTNPARYVGATTNSNNEASVVMLTSTNLITARLISSLGNNNICISKNINGECDQCLAAGTCNYGLLCNTTKEICYCNTNAECSANPIGNLYCNQQTEICIQCFTNSECPNGEECLINVCLPAISTIFEQIINGIASAMLAAAVISMVASEHPNKGFAVISIFQEFYFLVFLGVNYPPNLVAFLDIFKLGIMTFIPSFTKPPAEPKYSLPSPDHLYNHEYTGYFFQTGGTGTTVCTVVLGLYVVIKIVNLVKKNKFLEKLIQKLQWGLLTRVWLIFCAPLQFASILQLYAFTFSDARFGIGTLLSIIIIPFNFIFAYFGYQMIKKGTKNPQDHPFFFQEYRTNDQLIKYTSVMQLLRKITQPLIYLICYYVPGLQIFFLCLISISSSFYIGLKRPLKQLIDSFFLSYSDFGLSIVYFIMYSFIPNGANDFGGGTAIIVVLCTILFLQLFVTIADTYSTIRKTIKQMKEKNKVKQQHKQGEKLYLDTEKIEEFPMKQDIDVITPNREKSLVEAKNLDLVVNDDAKVAERRTQVKKNRSEIIEGENSLYSLSLDKDRSQPTYIEYPGNMTNHQDAEQQVI